LPRAVVKASRKKEVIDMKIATSLLVAVVFLGALGPFNSAIGADGSTNERRSSLNPRKANDVLLKANVFAILCARQNALTEQRSQEFAIGTEFAIP
jgi:hypothetical protein